MIKKTASSCLMCLDANNLHGWAMSQKPPVNGLERVEDLSQFKENFKNYDGDSNKGYFFEVDIEYPKNLHNLHSDLSFLPERNKIGKCNNLVYDLQHERLCCSHKVFKPSTKSWINNKKSAQSNSI